MEVRGFEASGDIRAAGSRGLDDGALLALAKGGDADASTRLFWRYRGMMASLIVNVHRVPSADVDDLLQEIYGKYETQLPRITFARGFFSVATTWACLNRRRDRFREREAMTAYGQESDGRRPWGAVQDRAAARLDVQRALHAAGERCQMLVRAILIDRLPHRDFAERTGTPMGSINPKLTRCLRRIKKYLEAAG